MRNWSGSWACRCTPRARLPYSAVSEPTPDSDIARQSECSPQTMPGSTSRSREGVTLRGTGPGPLAPWLIAYAPSQSHAPLQSGR